MSLKTFNEDTLAEINSLKQIYLHLIMEEETETPEIELINDEMDEYIIKIAKNEKNFEEISNVIQKEEIYNNKVFSDNLFKNIEKNAQSIIPNELYKTMIKNPFSKKKKEEKSVSKNDNNIDNFSNNNSKNDNKNNKTKLDFKQKYMKKKTYQIDKKEKDYINLCYLYSNPLLLKDNKNIYKDNDCFNQIVSIYNIFKQSNISANLKFEPVINNFNTYLESIPDILHINVNSTLEKKKLLIDLDYMGELQYYRCEDLKMAIGTEFGLSQIKLLILSSQNKKVMKTIFNNIGIQNIIYIEKKITYPEPNEQEVNFIKELYKNLLIEGLSIQESFNKSKGKVNDKSIVEIYPSTKDRNDYIIPQKENNNINNNEDFVQKFYSQKIYF